MTKILGISAFYHDSAAAIIINGKIIGAAQEERFNREKNSAVFPIESIKFCLEESGLTIDELDAVVFYDKPFLKFERLLETYYAFSPKGVLSFLKAIPVWLKEKLFLKKTILEGLHEVENYDKKKLNLLFSEHHLSHAASAYYTSSYNEAAVLTIDAVGEWSTASIGVANNANIKMKKTLNFPHSVGLLYSAFTYYLGFKVNSGEYKLMGLAPYGNPGSELVNRYKDIIKKKLVDIKEDGSIWMNQSYFKYSTGLQMTANKKWEALFGFAKRNSEDKITQKHCELALAIQQVTEEIVLKMVREAKRISSSDNLCMAGGVALNGVCNGKIKASGIFKNIHIQPASGDAGGALGAALAAHYLYFKSERNVDFQDESQSPYLGPSFSTKEVERMNKKMKANVVFFDSFNKLIEEVSQKITSGNVIGWFQGSMEFGPRALGNRSILADSSFVDIQKTVNLKIKKREGFRPFAPAVLEEDTPFFFGENSKSPHMLFVSNLNEELRNKIPNDFSSYSMQDKMNFSRSKWQAITHVDYSSRLQTVNKENNLLFWQLLRAIKKIKGKGILINTSFNVRGEPIVCTPEDAYRCFMNTEMDYLVINNFLYTKEAQKDWNNTEKWNLKFKKD